MSKRAETNLDEPSRRRLATLTGKEPASWRRVERGYTPAERWQITFADGSTAFAKLATTAGSARALRAEHAVYAQVSGPFLPKLLGFDDDPERPLLLLEDLSGAHWPPPWRSGDLQRLLGALRGLGSTPLADGVVPELERDRRRWAGWLDVERDAAPFLSLGLCSAGWLEASLPSLLLAQDLAWLGGFELVHGDLRSDNLCFAGERLMLVGWSTARRGSAQFDLASLAPSVRLGGGPLPDELVPGDGPLAALWSGYLAASAGLRPSADAPLLRHIQLRRLRVALPWAARVLGLPLPDVDWLRRASERRDADLSQGELDDAGWFQAAEEAIADAHLASADPRSPVCAGRDAAELRASDELVLDAGGAPERTRTLLWIGAGSAFGVDALSQVASQRGLTVDADALDISPRLAKLALERWPERAGRIESGPLLEHTPRRSYDVVVAALELVPRPRRREWLERLQTSYLAPGGRVVLLPERAGEGPDPAQRATALGLRPSGVLERVVPGAGSLRGAWLAR